MGCSVFCFDAFDLIVTYRELLSLQSKFINDFLCDRVNGFILFFLVSFIYIETLFKDIVETDVVSVQFGKFWICLSIECNELRSDSTITAYLYGFLRCHVSVLIVGSEIDKEFVVVWMVEDFRVVTEFRNIVVLFAPCLVTVCRFLGIVVVLNHACKVFAVEIGSLVEIEVNADFPQRSLFSSHSCVLLVGVVIKGRNTHLVCHQRRDSASVIWNDHADTVIA